MLLNHTKWWIQVKWTQNDVLAAASLFIALYSIGIFLSLSPSLSVVHNQLLVFYGLFQLPIIPFNVFTVAHISPKRNYVLVWLSLRLPCHGNCARFFTMLQLNIQFFGLSMLLCLLFSEFFIGAATITICVSLAIQCIWCAFVTVADNVNGKKPSSNQPKINCHGMHRIDKLYFR